MEPNKNTTSGSLNISENVIATISKITLDDVKGVHSLAEAQIPFKNVLLKSGPLSPVRISTAGGVATIDISVNLKYGFKIKDTSEEIQAAVKNVVQSMTGITVSKVNIHVADVIFSEEDKKE